MKNRSHVITIGIDKNQSFVLFAAILEVKELCGNDNDYLSQRCSCSGTGILLERPFLPLSMAINRSEFDEGVPAKRQKTSNGNMDPRNNPYLQHMYADQSIDNMSNGYNTPSRRMNGSTGSGPLAKFQRHQTTAALARTAEDGQTNPFTGESFSSRYMSILQTRRGLPVHSQRYMFLLYPLG